MDEPHPLEEKLQAISDALQDYVNVALATCPECDHAPRLVTGMVVVYETSGFDEETHRDNYTINYLQPISGQMSMGAGLLKIGSELITRDVVDELR